MGVMNRDGALYMATGIDNTGLYKGKQQAVGIVRTMMREITSFDVFAGIGLSAATAFAKAADGSFEFEKRFQSSMLEVSTISDEITNSLDRYKNRIIELTTDNGIPIHADEAAKALYQIVSAGHDGADAMLVLEASSRAAVGGVTKTVTAADAITTLLNAYNKKASEATNVSDKLFTTVKLGKTTMGELGKHIAQVAPVAAAYGVEMEQVLAATATLTSQGTPTAQAMTQIRQSIVATSKVLGDGAFETRTYQEALNEIISRANGSESALRSLVPEIEAVNGILGLTGGQSDKAAAHLAKMNDSLGATEEAFEKMSESADNQMKLLGNNIAAALRPMGASTLKIVSDLSQKLNEAFANGDLARALKTIQDLLVAGAIAWSSYKTVVILSKAATQAYNSVAIMEIATKTTNITLTKAHTAAIVKQTLAQLKANAAALANPYTAVAAALAVVGYAIYKHITALSAEEKAQKRFNGLLEEAKNRKEALKNKGNELIEALNAETSTVYQQIKAYKELILLLPKLKGKSLEDLQKMDPQELQKMLNERKDEEGKSTIEENYKNKLKAVKEAEERLQKLKDSFNDTDSGLRMTEGQKNKAIESVQSKIRDLKLDAENARREIEKISSIETEAFFHENPRAKQSALQEQKNKLLERQAELTEKIKKAGNDLESYNDRLELNVVNTSLENIEQQFTSVNKAIETGTLKNKEYWENEKKQAEDALGKLTDSNSKEEWASAKQRVMGAEKALDKYSVKSGGKSPKTDNSKEINKILLDLERQNILDTIALLEDGAEKQREQINADYDARISLIDEKEIDLREKQKGKLTQRQKDELKNSRSIADLIKKKADAEVDKKESDESRAKFDKLQQEWNEYYKAYGTYQEKRLAIIDEYAVKIQKAENDSEKLLYEKERDRVLEKLDVSMVDQSDLWIRLFSNAEKLTTDSLKKIIAETQNLLDYLSGVEGAETPLGFSPEQLEALKKDPEKVKAILESLKQKTDEFNRRNPFGNIIQGFKDLQKAGKDTEKQMKATAKIIEGFGDVSNIVNQVGQAFSGVNPEIDKTIDGIASIIGDTASSAMTGFQLGGPVGGVIGGVIGLGSGLIKMFGGAKELSEKTIKSYESYMKTLDDLIEKQKELIASSSGSQVVVEAERAKKLIEASIKASRDLGKEYLNSGTGWFSRSHGVKMKREMSSFRSELRTIGIDLDSLGGRVDGLFDLSADKLIQLQEEVPKLWAKLDESTRAYLQAVIDGDEKLKDLITTSQGALTGLSFDEARDALKSLLLETDSTLKNISDKFEDYMRNSIIGLVMDETMKKRLKSWYESYAGAIKDKGNDLSKSDVDKLREEYQKIAEDAIKQRDMMLEAAGIELNKSNNGVTGELKQEMTEGTASQLVGLWNMTAMDIRQMKEMMQRYGFTDMAKELNNLLSVMNDVKSNTGKTAENTKYLEKGFKDLEAKLEEIRKNTKSNNSRG